jgi:homoserine O-acetyltransferase
MKNNTVKTKFYTFGDADDARPFVLENGERFGPVTLAYETYGELNEARDNGILLFHALSGSQHAAGYNPELPEAGYYWTEECYTGWWDDFIGPGKALDTDRFFVVCANWLGGCYGTTGPSSINPDTGRPYGGSFPAVRTNDIVDSQMRLLDHLGIVSLHAVVGSSLGGMFALNLSVRYPERVRMAVIIASGLDVSVLQRLHSFEQIRAIEMDSAFNGGDYYDGEGPVEGLALARMISHKTFVSLSALQRRARRDVSMPEASQGFYQVNHPVESYMLYQGHKFARRFDANSYLRIVDTWQHFDLLAETGAKGLTELFSRCRELRFLVFSIDSDVCFYPEDQSDLVGVLHEAGVPCQHVTVHSEKGHDAFLLQSELFTPHLDYTLREQW